MAKVKKVKAIWVHNFCEQIEFEGSSNKKPDVMQVGKGQTFQMRVQVGSTFDEESGTWGNLLEFLAPEEEEQSNFGQSWNPVPPIDPQVLAAQEEAAKKLEADRAEAERLAEESKKGEPQGFVMP